MLAKRGTNMDLTKRAKVIDSARRGIAIALALMALLLLQSSALAAAPERRPMVYAWFPAKFGSWQTGTVPWDNVTHLCFRSVEIKADGSLRKPAGDPPTAFVETAHRHGVKVTVLAWTASAADSDGYLA